MIPIYSYGMGGECLVDGLICDECEMEKPLVPFRVPMRIVPIPKLPETVVEESVREIMEAAMGKLLSGEHTDAREAILEVLTEWKAPKVQ